MESTMIKQLNIRVYGKVQGVWFRKSMKEFADSLGLSGIIMNEPDKTVFIVIQGNDELLDKFVDYCKIGPELAEVQNLHIEEGKPTDIEGFKIIHA